MASYSAAQIQEPGVIQVVERARSSLGEGAARIRMEAVGICGSDVAVFEGTHPFARYPVVTGHEMAGVIEEGPSGSGLHAGRRVAIEPIVSCGQCHSCRHHQPNRCEQVQVLGIGLDGGMATEIDLPIEQLWPVPESLDPDLAALVEPAAVAVHVCRRGAIGQGSALAVVGTGKIGLLVLAVAQAWGADPLLGVDIVAERLAHAVAMGASATAHRPTQSVPQIAEGLTSEGFDVVVDTAGEADSMSLAFELARPGGTVVPVALPHAGLPVDFRPFYRKELTLRAARMYAGDFEAATRMISEGTLDPSSLITHRLPLSEVARGFELAAQHPEEAVKVIIHPTETLPAGRVATRHRETL